MYKPRSVIRRCFLKSTGSVAAGLTTLGPRVAAVAPPSETIRVGCIGVGNMGTGRLKQFMREKDCEVVAVCDVDRDHLRRARKPYVEAALSPSVETLEVSPQSSFPLEAA